MKRTRFTLIALLTLCLGVLTARAASKNEEPVTIYIFGFSASFSDSLVYITEIQKLESVQLEDKTGFLPSRSAYSNQLDYFLTDSLQRSHTTCAVFYDKKQDKLQKKYQNIIKRYKENPHVLVKVLKEEDFRFVREINQVISE